MKVVFLILLSVFCCTASLATVRVAFFEAYDHTGKVIRLLPDSEYFHVAIQIENVWYHTDQMEGVTVLEAFNDLGPQYTLKSILVNNAIDLPSSVMLPYLNMPFDLYYDWSNPKTTYCSKLIANILDIKPSVNLFQSTYWSQARGLKKGQEGVSPDELYAKLLEKGFYVGWPFHQGSGDKSHTLSARACRAYFL